MARPRDSVPQKLESLLERILSGTSGDDERTLAFHQAFAQCVKLPAAAFVGGEPVEVIELAADGLVGDGVVATCLRVDAEIDFFSVSDVAFPAESPGAWHVAAYRQWLGLSPWLPGSRRAPRQKRGDGLDFGCNGLLELAVLSIRDTAARCRLQGTSHELTLRCAAVRKRVPGEIVTVRPDKQWRRAGHLYISGEVVGNRLDIAALELVPLRLEDQGTWNPAHHYWGEEGEPLEEWARRLIARGVRPSFEMEQVLPGRIRSDPIIAANRLYDAGDWERAHRKLIDLVAADIRCLDAHAHLGLFTFDEDVDQARRHYEVGVRIGELSLGDDFDGMLPWGWIDNRPFLRCLHGYGLSLWRLGQRAEAQSVFERALCLNPSDNQGIRFLLPELRAGRTWEDYVGAGKPGR